MRPHSGSFSQKAGQATGNQHATLTHLSSVLPGGPFDHTLADSHGADGGISGFYCTSYGTNFNRSDGGTSTGYLCPGVDNNSAWSRNQPTQALKFDDKARRSMSAADLENQACTAYTEAYRTPTTMPLVLTNVHPAIRPFYPDHSKEGISQRPASMGKSPHDKQPKSAYRQLISEAPQAWLERQRKIAVPVYTDSRQSAYRSQGNDGHTFFVSPEMMETNLKYSHLGKTAHAEDYPPPDGPDITGAQSVPSRVRNASQYNGTQGSIGTTLYPIKTNKNNSKSDRPDPERWKTNYNEIHKWKNWRAFEDDYASKRPFGPTKTETTGFVQNMPNPYLVSEYSRFRGPEVPDKWNSVTTKEFQHRPIVDVAVGGHARCFVPTDHIIKVPFLPTDSDRYILNRLEQRVGQPGVRERTQNEILGRPPGFAEPHWNQPSRHTTVLIKALDGKFNFGVITPSICFEPEICSSQL